MCVLANLVYFSVLFCAVFWAAAPGLVAVLPMWDSAYVSGTVTSEALLLLLLMNITIVPVESKKLQEHLTTEKK